MRKTLIIGATSAIAEAVARRLAAQGDALYLTGRDGTRLATIVADLQVRGAERVETTEFDVLDFARHETIMDDAAATLGGLDLVLIAHGTLPDQRACEENPAGVRAAIEVNGVSTVSLAEHAAAYMQPRGMGTIAVITSVAGDRGRQSNYVYGAAKGLVQRYLEGMRNRLFKQGIEVIDIRPGFVETPMTAAFDTSGPLWASPDQVAKSAVRALNRGGNLVYVPWFWRWIMLVIRAIPEPLFKRLSL